MSEPGQAEMPKKSIYNPELRQDYEKVRPTVKNTEKAIGETDGKTRRLVRRSAFFAAREKQHEVDEANIRADDAEKQLGKDTLTGAHNKEKFKEDLKTAVMTHVRLNRPFSVLMMDLDNFKLVNDTYGHMVGDIAIQEFADLLHSEIRGIDVLARFGGDEFALILPGTAQEWAKTAAEKLRETITLQFLGRVSGSMPGRKEPFTASIGLSSFQPNGMGQSKESIEQITEKLLTQADIALYNSKRDNIGNLLKDRVTVYQDGMTMPSHETVHTDIES